MPNQKAKPKINPKQKRFIDAYTDSEAKTYGNATQSAITAGYGGTYKSSSVQGHHLLDRPNIKSEIERILDEQDASYKVRLTHLTDIALGRNDLQAQTENRDADGNLVSTAKTTRSVPTADRLKALKLISDLTGETQMAHTRGEILSSHLRGVSKRLMKRVGSQTIDDTTEPIESRDGNPRASEGNSEGAGPGLEGGKGGGLYTIHSPPKIDATKKADPLSIDEKTGVIEGEDGEF